jgi:hypothetical protein
MKATSALIPELKEKIENLINCLSGTIMTFPHIVTEVIKIIPTEATRTFEGGKLYKLICETTLEGRSNLHTLGLVIGWDSYDLMKIADKMEVDHESTCEMLHELLKQYLTIYSIWEYESKLLAGENHESALLAAELIKHESRLFTAEAESESNFIEYIQKFLSGTDSEKTTAPLDLEFCKEYEEGDLVIVAGRPGMGKSMYLLNCLERWALLGKRGIVFSLEMGTNQLKSRLLNMMLGYDARNEKHRAIEIIEVSEKIEELHVVFSGARSISQIESKAKLENLAKKVDFILIDYVQLIKGNKSKNGTRDQEIGETARTLKELAMTLKIPIIALAQLSREVEKRGNKRPQLSDLRESGSLEQEADIVKFLYRPEYYGIEYDENSCSTKGLAEIIVAKYRNGSVGTNNVAFHYVNGFFKPLPNWSNSTITPPSDLVF